MTNIPNLYYNDVAGIQHNDCVYCENHVPSDWKSYSFVRKINNEYPYYCIRCKKEQTKLKQKEKQEKERKEKEYINIDFSLVQELQTNTVTKYDICNCKCGDLKKNNNKDVCTCRLNFISCFKYKRLDNNTLIYDTAKGPRRVEITDNNFIIRDPKANHCGIYGCWSECAICLCPACGCIGSGDFSSYENLYVSKIKK